MNMIIEFVKTLDLWILIAVPAAVAVIIIVIVLVSVRRSRFKKEIEAILEDEKAAAGVLKSYSPNALLRRSGLIEKVARKRGEHLPLLLGMDRLWTERLQEKRGKKDFFRVLKYAPGKGLFYCFLASLKKESLVKFLVGWLQEHEDFFILRKVALSGRGEDFSGEAALAMFGDKIDEIREMMGDPEWASRYFAVKILLYDKDDRSRRIVWTAFEDSHPLIRKVMCREYRDEDREKLYQKLYSIQLTDPVFEVRKSGRERIKQEFSDLYSVDTEKLGPVETLHVLELLDVELHEDENAALRFLESSNLEHRMAAAFHLEQKGTLKSLFIKPDFSDRDDLERTYRLLKNAAEVNITGFLHALHSTSSPASLLVASRILKESGDRELITVLTEKVLHLVSENYENQEFLEIYRSTMECIEKRGTEKTLDLLNQELLKIRNNSDLLEIVLPYMPNRGDFLFRRTLIDFMKDPEFPCRDVLRATMKILPTTVLIPELFSILKADRSDYPHIVRIEALKLLGELKAPYCLQHILEHLPTLPAEEARNFATVLSSYNEDLFIERAGEILESVDANVRSTLISSLPATGKQVFLKQIQKSLADADPEVRIASVWAILEYKDVKSLNQTAGMLRDPVERVRKEVARVLGSHGSPSSLKELHKVLEDENEVLSVKEAAITGLAYSRELKSIDILIESFGKDEEIKELLIDALAEKTEKKEITGIIEQFKDASPDVRDNISQAFMKMREESEASILELLKEDIASLRPHLTEVLEKTGYVESRIRLLAHRDPQVRRTAAETLSYIGTTSAFRGMVLAARDPDSEVRVKVTKALEQLETDEGKMILNELENDPDKRVRKYTLWALERLRAKEL